MHAQASERTLPQHTAQMDADLALLAELIGQLQIHRGASLAALGGAQGFQQQLQDLQPQIDQLLARLTYAATQADPALWQLIQSEWRNTRKHWRQDNALNNFEIHSFLIEQCHRMLWGQLTQTLGGKGRNWELLKELAAHTECLAQLRGLVSYAMATGAETPQAKDLQGRIVQLNRQSQTGLIDTQQALIKYSTQHAINMPPLRARVQLTGQFLQGIQTYINSRCTLSAEKIFHLGTLAIEANQQVWQLLMESL